MIENLHKVTHNLHQEMENNYKETTSQWPLPSGPLSLFVCSFILSIFILFLYFLLSHVSCERMATSGCCMYMCVCARTRLKENKDCLPLCPLACGSSGFSLNFPFAFHRKSLNEDTTVGFEKASSSFLRRSEPAKIPPAPLYDWLAICSSSTLILSTSMGAIDGFESMGFCG